MGIYIIYILMYSTKAACHRLLRHSWLLFTILHKSTSHLLFFKHSCCLVRAFLSQDVVDGPGSGAFRRAGLRFRSAGREGGRVPQSCRPAAGLHRGQAVHDAGETLQAGGSWCLVGKCVCEEEGKVRIRRAERAELKLLRNTLSTCFIRFLGA